jgi:signal transduction histidine kinase
VSTFPSILTVPAFRSRFNPLDRSTSIRFDSMEELPPSALAIVDVLGIGSAVVTTLVSSGDLLGYLVVSNRASSGPVPEGTEERMTFFAECMAIGVDHVRATLRLHLTVEEAQRFFSMAPVGLLSVDSKGIIRSANPQMLNILSAGDEKAVTGTSIFEIQSIVKSGLDQLVLQGMEGHSGEKTDVRLVPSPDRALYLHAKVAPVRDESGSVHEAIVVAMDITSNIRLQNQLERSYEKLTQIDVVSHELRTPLTVMRGYVDLLQSECAGGGDPKLSQKLNVIKTNTDKLYGLVESMLDVSRLEKGTLQIHPEPVKIDAILQEVVGARTADANEKRQTITLEIEGELPLIKADRRRMKDVFNHVIDNAVKYTQEEGRVKVGARDEGRTIHVWVKDNGIGIPLENLGKIFDRFYIVASDDLSHQVDRIGLSLPISRGIVEAHGGRIWVESQVGKGSVFHVNLPKVQ